MKANIFDAVKYVLLRNWFWKKSDSFEKLLSFKPRTHIVSKGNGRAMKTRADDTHGKDIHITLQRKIESADFENGELLPTVIQGIKKRGGKRYTSLKIRSEDALLLSRLLIEAVKDAEKVQTANSLREYALNVTEYLIQDT